MGDSSAGFFSFGLLSVKKQRHDFFHPGHVRSAVCCGLLGWGATSGWIGRFRAFEFESLNG